MDEKQLQALANKLPKNLKTPAALNAEMPHHLGYDTNQPKPAANARNGYTQKTVITGDDPLELGSVALRRWQVTCCFYCNVAYSCL